MNTIQMSLSAYHVPPEAYAMEFPNVRREVMALACKRIVEMNERNAEQAMIIELERRLTIAERQRDDAQRKLGLTEKALADATRSRSCINL